jgi:hypothetical protein
MDLPGGVIIVDKQQLINAMLDFVGKIKVDTSAFNNLIFNSPNNAQLSLPIDHKMFMIFTKTGTLLNMYPYQNVNIAIMDLYRHLTVLNPNNNDEVKDLFYQIISFGINELLNSGAIARAPIDDKEKFNLLNKIINNTINNQHFPLTIKYYSLPVAQFQLPSHVKLKQPNEYSGPIIPKRPQTELPTGIHHTTGIFVHPTHTMGVTIRNENIPVPHSEDVHIQPVPPQVKLEHAPPQEVQPAVPNLTNYPTSASRGGNSPYNTFIITELPKIKRENPGI